MAAKKKRRRQAKPTARTKPQPIDAVAEETHALGNAAERLPGPLGNLKTDPVPDLLDVRLVVTAGPDKGRVYPITKGLTVLGRLEDVADVVIDDEVASRHHACVRHRDGKFTLYDLGSTNGTRVNGVTVDSFRLRDGHDIQIGAVVLTFRME